MAVEGPGVLPFVRGIDLSKNDLHTGFPSRIKSMTNLRWLRLDRSNLSKVPEDIGSLSKLEHLSLVKNKLNSLTIDVENLPNLKVINARHNNLKNASIPDEVFKLDDLLTVDLSHNDIIEIPEELENASELLVLNLSNNRITAIPNQLFMHLTDLIFLDMSNNLLETIPPQLRRLTNLQTLVLNNNPLLHAQLRQIPSLAQLHTLHLRNTQRTISNMPSKLDSLENLADLDLSHNDLPRVPEPVYRMTKLKRLDLSHNKITELSTLIDSWTKLETLNLSRNELCALPHTICKMTALKRLYVNSNMLTFEGIPLGIGKLLNLEVFMAAWNKLECIPEGVCRCMKLKKLILHSNCLITLPEGIHFLANLENLDTRNNPKLVMPPKPVSQSEADAEFYNIDFSYQTQLRLAAGQSPSALQTKDPIARKMRLRGRRYQSINDADKKLKGMVESAEEKKHKKLKRDDEGYETTDGNRTKTGKKVMKIVKPDLNYADIFQDDVGTEEGITVWVIENFLPVQVEEAFHGKFYDGDCYIILKSFYDDTDQLNYQIYYWIGQHCTLDKKACAAIHAVNLRNLLGAEGRTAREEQSDESDEFLNLFDSNVSYIEGGNNSGFYSVEDVVYTTRLYRLYGTQGIKVEPVNLTWESLDPNYVFVCDAGLKIYVWSGSKAKLMFKTKGRLFADKINKCERKNKAEIIQIIEDEIDEAMDFWNVLGGPPTARLRDKYDYKYFAPKEPILYKVGLGMGYLELPQVEIPDKKLNQKLLDTKCVYILDCWSDVFIWIGRRSARLVRAAALKLAQELAEFLARPSYATVSRNLEGVEQSVFKSKFVGWDDVLAVDFTKTADRVSQMNQENNKKKADSKEASVVPNLPPPKVQKVDLAALFTARQLPMSDQECDQLSEEWNDDLDQMECFVLEGRKFVRLPEDEIGHFYSGDCYVFLCRYWVPPEEGDADEDEQEEEEKEDDFQCVVYFWEGRDAGKMGWLTFAFSLQKKFEALFRDKLEVVRTRQQQEAMKFLSHFKGKFIVEKGKRKHTDVEGNPKLFEIRSTMGKLTRRAMQVECDATMLNTNFCFVLKVPFDNSGGIIYVWIGTKCDNEQTAHAEEIGSELAEEGYSLQVISEGEEPENFFWVGIGGKKDIQQNAEFADQARLFRCSNERGFFTVSEKCSDFCQDDLADDDVMLLDTGTQLFLWIGETASDIEKKLSVKAAQVYMQHIKEQKLGPQRKLHLTAKRKEPFVFARCFHGWSEWPSK